MWEISNIYRGISYCMQGYRKYTIYNRDLTIRSAYSNSIFDCALYLIARFSRFKHYLSHLLLFNNYYN